MKCTRGLAYHEAGHVVVAWYFGRPIGSVSIMPAEQSGHSEIGKSRVQAGEAWEQESMILLAGGRAQKRVDPKGVISGIGAFSDEAKVIGHIQQHLRRNRGELGDRLDDETDRIRGRLCQETENILDRPEIWRAVEIVAEALSEKHRLDADEVTRMIEGAPGVKRPTAP